MSSEEPASVQEKKAKKIKLAEEEYQALLAKAKELDEVKDRFLRQAADFDNAKKRLLREKTDFLKFANEGILRGLLPILDNLDRALLHFREKVQDNPSFTEGMDLIRKQLTGVVHNFGLRKIEVLGKNFDPHFHEAVACIETGEVTENTVLEEVLAGYFLHDRVLRAAKVKIARQKNQANTEDRGQKPGGEDEPGSRAEDAKSV